VLIRDALVLVGCLAVLGLTGEAAAGVLTTASVSPIQATRTSVRVSSDDVGGMAKLALLAPIRLSSGGSTRLLPAGTQFGVGSSELAAATASGPPGPVGTVVPVNQTLTCDLLIGWSQGQPVIDVERCAPPLPSQ
jgi:hypothetical protein